VTTADRAELVDRLTEGIAALAGSREWRRYLSVQSRFHRYSPSNALLIALQCPTATQVAGFGAWRRLHRVVRRGERAIWILAPIVRRDPDAEDGRAVAGFKFVAVFDVAQTDGPELPTPCRPLAGDDPAGHYARLVAVAEGLGFTVEDHTFAGGVNGDCSHESRRLRVEVANPPAQRVKTLAHELGHALLHASAPDRALAELEAESTAYVVCRALGMDSARYSFGYVTLWAGGGDAALAGIRSSCGRIQRAAAAILDGGAAPADSRR